MEEVNRFFLCWKYFSFQFRNSSINKCCGVISVEGLSPCLKIISEAVKCLHSSIPAVQTYYNITMTLPGYLCWSEAQLTENKHLSSSLSSPLPVLNFKTFHTENMFLSGKSGQSITLFLILNNHMDCPVPTLIMTVQTNVCLRNAVNY